MELSEAYKALKTAGERNSNQDDRDLAGLADTRFWQALKEGILQPKIAGLLISIDRDTQAYMEGKLSKDLFAEKTILARLVAGHLQDIIDVVEQTRDVVVEQVNRKEEENDDEK